MNGFSGLAGRMSGGRTKHGKRLAVTSIVLALACMAVGVGSAWAESGIALCVPKKEGSAVFTPKHGACKKGYKLTSIQEGKDGKAGAEGKPGADGKAGIAGAKGEPGEPGKGTPGPEGKAGKEGPEGKEGPAGSMGLGKAELETLKAILPHIQFVASGVGHKPTVQFSGVNVQVVSGAGTTKGAVNGMGNLVIGYDENAGLEQTGSHNLILGEEQTFTSFGGIVAGFKNAITGQFTSVTGGGGNKATVKEASVSGGWKNTAGAEDSSVSGGRENHTTGEYSWVGGGLLNTASGELASIFGGNGNTASVKYEAIP